MNLQSALRNELLLFRGKYNLSQEEMANRCSISVRYYRGIEGGKGNPSLKILAKFRIQFGIDLNKLVDVCKVSVKEDF